MSAFIALGLSFPANATPIGTGETVSLSSLAGQNIDFTGTLTYVTSGTNTNYDTGAAFVNLTPNNSVSGTFTGNLGTGPDEVQWLGSGGFKATSDVPYSTVAIGGLANPTALTWNVGGFVPTGSALVLGQNVVFRNDINLGSDASVTRQIDVNSVAFLGGNITGAGNLLLQAYGMAGSNLVLQAGSTIDGSINIGGELTLNNVIITLGGTIKAASFNLTDKANLLAEVLGSPSITMSGGSIWQVFPYTETPPYTQSVDSLNSTDPSSLIDLASGSNVQLTVHSGYFAGRILEGNTTPIPNTGGSLVKDGPGIFTLANDNSGAGGPGTGYTQGTTVKQGTLLVTNTEGSATGSGPVRVMSGAKFGGTGIIAPTGTNAFVVEAGGVVDLSATDPAHPPDALTNTMTILLGEGSKATFDAGSSFVFDVAADGASDQIAFQGQPTDGTGPSVLFNDNQVTLKSVSDLSDGTYTLFTFNQAGLYSGTLQGGADYTFHYGANDISITIGGTAAVPEPSTVGILIAGVVLLFAVRARLRPTVPKETEPSISGES